MRIIFLLGVVSFVACSSSVSTPPATASDGGDADAGEVDAAPVTNAGIACKGATCDRATQVCCLFKGANECQLKDECGGAYLECSSPASCDADQVCCGVFTAMGGHATCATTCTTTRLCATKADCPEGESCVAGGPAGPLSVVSTCQKRLEDGGVPPPPPPPDGG
jgi:hypothetical protein